jgi:hypothetical protein
MGVQILMEGDATGDHGFGLHPVLFDQQEGISENATLRRFLFVILSLFPLVDDLSSDNGHIHGHVLDLVIRHLRGVLAKNNEISQFANGD